MPSKSPAQRRLDAFEYRDGVLYWKQRPRDCFSTLKSWATTNARLTGKPAGTVGANGYVEVKIDRKTVKAHRLIFEMFHGWCPDEVDHINGIRTDNRIENLRPATDSQTTMNSKLRADNTSGVKNLHWSVRDKSWIVRVRIKGVEPFVKYFKDRELAELVAEEATRLYHGDYFRSTQYA